MSKVQLDLSDKRIAEQSKNATALSCIIILNIVLPVAYFVEVLKGSRTIGSYAIIAILCILPMVLSIVEYLRKKESVLMRYISSIGFGLLYGYVMFTSTSDLAFCYIIVFFVVAIVYSDLRLSMILTCFAITINVIVIGRKAFAGTLTGIELTNAEIMLACIILTCVFAMLSIKKVSQINQAGYNHAESQRLHSEEMLNTILQVSSSMTEDIEKAVEETDSLKDSIHMTQNAMENLVAGTNETVNAIEDQKKNTDRINVHIQEVEESVNSIMAEINNAEEKLEAGNVVMKDLLKQVKASEDAGELVAREMADLSEYAGKMQTIMGLISSVANQTGLLALNASIEAARAGEAGRGFAVVASEISNLAAQTNSATGEIDQIIDNITKSLTEVTESMDTLLENSRLQNQYVDSTANNFAKLHDSTQHVVTQAKQLKSVVDAVMDANKQVIDGIDNVSAVTQEVTAGANETLESSNVNLKSIEKVADVMVKLGREAKELQASYSMK